MITAGTGDSTTGQSGWCFAFETAPGNFSASAPETFIVFGGANCEGVMGAETLRQCRFVDAVVSDFELILMRSDGSALSCDLLPAFERYQREVA
jgi:hypothetical protein